MRAITGAGPGEWTTPILVCPGKGLGWEEDRGGHGPCVYVVMILSLVPSTGRQGQGGGAAQGKLPPPTPNFLSKHFFEKKTA